MNDTGTNNNIVRVLEWLDKSTCNFLAVATMRKELEARGFVELSEKDAWHVEKGGKYYVVKNGSAIFPFVVGQEPLPERGFRIVSAHSDSPCFKIKPHSEIYGDGGVVKLNVEKYGGCIMSTWFDRPLSISGRVNIRCGGWNKIEERLVDMRRPVATIPNLAIHFNRQVNDGVKLSVQKDMLPIVGYYSDEEIKRQKENGGLVLMAVADELGVKPEDIVGYELCLYPAERAQVIVMNQLTGPDRISSRRVSTTCRWPMPVWRLCSTCATRPAAQRACWPYSTTRRPARVPSRVRLLPYCTTYWSAWPCRWITDARISSAPCRAAS